MTFTGLRIPTVTVVIGEGGSGGALALAVCDRVLMLENSIYSVISPEGCAALLWRDSAEGPKAAEALRLIAIDLLELGLIDAVIPEPTGGAHTNHRATVKRVMRAGAAGPRRVGEARPRGTTAPPPREVPAYGPLRAWNHGAGPASARQSPARRRTPGRAARHPGTTRCEASTKSPGSGGRGLREGDIPTSDGRHAPLRTLQGAHEVTTLSHEVAPPRLRGMMWSMVRCRVLPQYWQRKPSRARIARRDTRRAVGAGQADVVEQPDDGGRDEGASSPTVQDRAGRLDGLRLALEQQHDGPVQ